MHHYRHLILRAGAILAVGISLTSCLEGQALSIRCLSMALRLRSSALAFPPTPQSDAAPHGFDDPKWPRSLQEAIHR